MFWPQLWYVTCWMMAMNFIPDTAALDAPHLTLLFVGTVVCLATALVWMFCELERRIGKKQAPTPLSRYGYRPDSRRDRDS
ncbi:hypothetical protein [Tardiphaga sp.]|uniref:hypothetical protein n=1 Tax=Tardiphaga sp. TaxID=1926292 RepID=UPI00262BB2F4|nr:hypothetical protein [Tardiphaga sp.]MDB5616067.1 hypothetical protein [Tardiphaga sp.]